MATAPERALVVYSRVGGGHQSAARAIAHALERAGRGRLTCRVVDLYVDHSRYPVSRFPAFYARLARYHPRLWSAIFDLTRGRRRSPEPLLRPFVRPGLNRLLSLEAPSLVVSVLPVVNGLLVEAARQVEGRPPVEVVLTDWAALHPTWTAEGVAHYTTPTEVARQDCLAFGVACDRIEVVGLPVREPFSRPAPTPSERAQARRELGLEPDRFTILAMVGAEGSPRAFANIAAVAAMDLPAQLVVVCGRNVHLQRRVEQLPAGLPRRVLGFVDHIAELMSTADLLITKAGGVTLAEAFCRRVPVVVNDVLPGQEAGNAEFVLREGAAAYAGTPSDLTELISRLAGAPDERSDLAARGQALARPEAARITAERMLERLWRAV